MPQTKVKGEDVHNKSIKAIDIDFSTATEKTTLVDNDSILINDSADENTKRSKISSLLAYFNAIFQRKTLLQELSSLSDTIPAGFRGLFSKSSGLWVKKSDNSEHRLLTSDDYLDITPRKTLTGLISAAGYFAFAQTELNHTQYSGVFKITASGAGGIGHTLYLRVEGDSIYIPSYQADSQTNFQSAALTGIYYIRMVFPKTVNNGYRSFIEFYTYNTTARTITVEAIDMKGLSLLASFTATTYSSTYQNIQTPAVLFNGILTNGTGLFSISGSSDVTFRVYNNNYLAGESLVAYDIIFLDDSNSRWYKVLVNNRLIPMGAVIAICLTTYAAGVTVSCHSHVLTFLPAGFPGTLHKDIYAAGTLDVSGKFKSNGTITGTPTGNAAFIRLGRAAQGTTQILKDNNNDFFATGNYSLVDKIIKSFNGFKFDAEMLAGRTPADYAKIDTAFTTWDNIPSNTPPVHVHVLDATGVLTYQDLYMVLDTNILDTAPKVFVLQPGTYSIGDIIDCSTHNLVGIIGLSKHDTIIEIECNEALTNLKFLENVTLKITAAFTGTFLVSAADSAGSYVKSVSVACDDIVNDCFDVFAFQGFNSVENVDIRDVSGACNECKNISGVIVVNSTVTTATDVLTLFYICVNLSNINITHNDFNKMFSKCDNVSNVVVNLASNENSQAIYSCTNVSNCNITGAFVAVASCTVVTNVIISTATTGILDSAIITNCKTDSCTEYGFADSEKLSNCLAANTVLTGYYRCRGMVNNKADSNTTNYNSCNADLGGLFTVSDTPNGGFNA